MIIFNLFSRFVALYRKHHPVQEDFAIDLANGDKLSWTEFCLHKQNYDKDTTSVFLQKHFETFYSSSYVRTAVLDSFWAGCFADFPKSTLRNLFARLGEQKLETWIPWIQHKHHNSDIEPNDLEYYLAISDIHGFVRGCLYPPTSLVLAVNELNQLAITPTTQHPFDLVRFLSVWVIHTREWNPRVWFAILKLKHNMVLHASDKDYIGECF